MTTGLILSGGGARAAYQVGVLKGIASILPRAVYNPFPIIAGTSAGAINAAAIAGRAGPFKLRVRKLEAIWENLRAENIYRCDVRGVLKSTFNVVASLFHSGYGRGQPISLLDNGPLRRLLTNYIRFDHIQTAIDNDELQAIAITSMNYASGHSITFYQGHSEIQPWSRARRRGVRGAIDMDHLMASSAIPSVFPAVRIGDYFFGDGALRQLKPISPALHLGADKLVIVGVSDNPVHLNNIATADHSPSIAQIIGHMLNSAFIDSIESDLETLRMINRLMEAIPESQRSRRELTDLRPIQFINISPSQPIDKIAEEHLHELPTSIKILLRLTGATGRGGGVSATSYLLFEPGFCRKLIELGYQDTLRQREQIREFFELE